MSNSYYYTFCVIFRYKDYRSLKICKYSYILFICFMYTSLSLLILLIGRILISFLCTIIKKILFTICLLGLMHLLWDLYGNMLSLMMWKWGNSFSYISLSLIIKCYISIQIIIILNLCT